MATVTILRIDCIMPSTGVASWWETGVTTVVDVFCTTVGGALGGAAGAAIEGSVVTAATSALAVATAPIAVVTVPAAFVADVLGMTSGAVIGATIGGPLGSAIGLGVSAAVNEGSEFIGQKIHDQVYVEADDDAIWPSGSGLLTPTVNMNAGDFETPNVRISVGSSPTTIKLKEWDNIKDDTLGELVVSSASQSGVYMFANPDEGDVYAVTIQVDP